MIMHWLGTSASFFGVEFERPKAEFERRPLPSGSRGMLSFCRTGLGETAAGLGWVVVVVVVVEGVSLAILVGRGMLSIDSLRSGGTGLEVVELLAGVTLGTGVNGFARGVGIVEAVGSRRLKMFDGPRADDTGFVLGVALGETYAGESMFRIGSYRSPLLAGRGTGDG